MKNYPALFTPSGRTLLTHRRPLNVHKFWLGVCYYPEHWSPEAREKDPERMAAAGVNVVRMAEFAWDRMEPSPGQYDFSLFDETIERLAPAGISTILCTPTATPPRWLTHAHPEILRTDAQGGRMQHGSRQHASYAHPLFRQHSARITQAMADHFKGNPHVVGWQTDNEIYCQFAEDHGPEIQEAFRAFLRRKFHDDIDALNRAWGTAFWALTFDHFDQIETPRNGRPTFANPAQLLDYHRFLTDVVENFQHDQVTILRHANPHWFIFHNGLHQRTDYRGPFTQDLDFLGVDFYPFFESNPAARVARHAFYCDRVRAMAGNFIVPEQQSGFGSQATFCTATPEPGEMRMHAYLSIARGADSLLFFRWRTCRFGAEIYWLGILDHDNVPRRRYTELQQIGNELGRIGPELLGTSVHVEAAVAASDYDENHAHEAYPLALPRAESVAEGVHRKLWEAGYAVGAVHPADDLSGIKLYVVPHWAYFDPAWVANLVRFVEEGGVLVIGARTASRDTDNNVVAETLPGCLRGLAGVTVTDYAKEIAAENRPKQVTLDGGSFEAAHWTETLEPARGTEVIGTWQGRALTGKAAVTLKRHGEGHVIYVGTYLTPEATEALLPTLAKLAGLAPTWKVPAGVEVVKRCSDKRTLWFFLNHTDAEVTLADLPKGIDLTTMQPTGDGPRRLPIHGVCVIKETAR